MKKTAQEPKVTDNPLYHDTWMLLRKYRDVVWSLELSVQQVRRQFQIEYGSSIEEFLESLYVAGVTFEGSAIEDHARCIERSYKMLKLLDTSVELLRTKHKYHLGDLGHGRIRIPLYTGTGKRKAARRPQSSL